MPPAAWPFLTGRAWVRRSTRQQSAAGSWRRAGSDWRPVYPFRRCPDLDFGGTMKVGFIGLGHMGAPMSRNILAAGHALAVHDLRRGAAEPLVAEGAVWACSPVAVGSG